MTVQQLINANTLRMPLAAKSVHMIATSVPYWNLRSYSTGELKHLELGQEPLHDCLAWARNEPPCGVCYVCNMRAFAAECHRVLRDDGIFFCNLGDSYSNTGKWGGESGGKNYTSKAGNIQREKRETGLKPKDLCMIPQRVALALQADGWYLRNQIPWIKRNCMPGSQDDRPTTSTEYIFLLAKSKDYFFDMEAVKRPAAVGYMGSRFDDDRDLAVKPGVGRKERVESGTRSLRENDFFFDSLEYILNGGNGLLVDSEPLAFCVNTQGWDGAHFATWPEKLVEPMIKAGTSERGVCPACGAQWERVTIPTGHVNKREPAHAPNSAPTKTDSTGWGPTRKDSGEWQPTCTCNAGEPIAATVLDPFAGSGTTLLVARRLGRNAIGLDLSMTYLQECARERLGANALDSWTSGKGKKDGASLNDLPMFGSEVKP